MARLFFLFNHRATPIQERNARKQLGVEAILSPPPEILRLWANIPPEPASLRPILKPVFSWIDVALRPGDYLLVQGEFGACYLVVEYVRPRRIIPVYSTTYRNATEQRLPDSSIQLTHTVNHVRYRQYGQ